MRIFFTILILISFFSCSKKETKKPSYITFKIKNDSLFVVAKNPLYCPTFLTISSKDKNTNIDLDFNSKEEKMVQQFLKKNIDTSTIFDRFSYKMRYGTSFGLKKYDTTYNYALPFLKGKRYKILQGQNTNFTHKGALSKYAIDFKMNVGQTVCAMRDGIVISIKEDSNVGGRDKKYRNDGNYIMLYHEDGLFTQYVHLKKDGAIVKVGDTVKKHQPIGFSGNTGYSTEPHLHFGVFKPTKTGFVSIPYILDSIPTKRYVKGKFAHNN